MFTDTRPAHPWVYKQSGCRRRTYTYAHIETYIYIDIHMCMSEYVHMRGNNKRPPQTVETNNNTITYRCLGPPTPSTLWSPGTHKQIRREHGNQLLLRQRARVFRMYGPKKAEDGLRTAQDGRKRAPRDPQDGSRGLQEEPPEGPKRQKTMVSLGCSLIFGFSRF